jgi:hypothetical protein
VSFHTRSLLVHGGGGELTNAGQGFPSGFDVANWCLLQTCAFLHVLYLYVVGSVLLFSSISLWFLVV